MADVDQRACSRRFTAPLNRKQPRCLIKGRACEYTVVEPHDGILHSNEKGTTLKRKNLQKHDVEQMETPSQDSICLVQTQATLNYDVIMGIEAPGGGWRGREGRYVMVCFSSGSWLLSASNP